MDTDSLSNNIRNDGKVAGEDNVYYLIDLFRLYRIENGKKILIEIGDVYGITYVDGHIYGINGPKFPQGLKFDIYNLFKINIITQELVIIKKIEGIRVEIVYIDETKIMYTKIIGTYKAKQSATKFITGLVKIDLDGNKEELVSDKIGICYVSEGYVYNLANDNKIYKINIETKNEEIIFEGHPITDKYPDHYGDIYCKKDNWLYMYHYPNVIRISLETKEVDILFKNPASSCNIYEGNIYWRSGNPTHVYNLETRKDKVLVTKKRKPIEMSHMGGINILGDWIYFIDSENRGEVARISIDRSRVETLF